MFISTSSKLQDQEFKAQTEIPPSTTPTVQNHFITNLHVQQGQVVQDIDFWNSIVQSLPVSTIKIIVMQISICNPQIDHFVHAFGTYLGKRPLPYQEFSLTL